MERATVIAMMNDLIDWVIEESKWEIYTYTNGRLSSIKRRFPPYYLYKPKDYTEEILEQAGFKLINEFRIYNRPLTEKECNFGQGI